MNPMWGRRTGRRGEGRGTVYTQPFHHSAGRWMVFGSGCPGAPARYRETSERSGLPWRSPPAPPRLGFLIKSGPGGDCSSGAGGGSGGAPPRSWSCGHSSSGTEQSPLPASPRASRAFQPDHARPRAAACSAGADSLPSASGAGRPGAGGQRDRAGQDVPAWQPLGGG